MAPSAGVSARWDRLYGRSFQCHFLPSGDQDLVSGSPWWSWQDGRAPGYGGVLGTTHTHSLGWRHAGQSLLLLSCWVD